MRVSDVRIEALLGQVGKAMGGDFRDKPEIGDDDSPFGQLVVGIRFLLDELELAHEQRAREVERLRQIDEVKTRFVRTAAHELGTPLTPLLIQLALLQRTGPLSARQGRSLAIVCRNVERIHSLVAHMLDVAKIGAGDLQLDAHVVEVGRTVHEAVEAFRPVADEQGMTIEAAIEEGLVVRGDPDRLYQVVQNLVSNALKYAPKGTHVFVQARAEEDQVEIAVQDEGPGMTAEEMARIFRPFARVYENASGTGLGLYICKGIVEQHGGVIGCTSKGRGHGMRFRVLLPASSISVARRPS